MIIVIYLVYYTAFLVLTSIESSLQNSSATPQNRQILSRSEEALRTWKSLALAKITLDTCRSTEDYYLLFSPTIWTHTQQRRSPMLMGAAYSSDIIGDGQAMSIWTDEPMFPVSAEVAVEILLVVLCRSMEFSFSQIVPP